MIIYADVLIAVNIIINFLLLMLTAKVCKTGYNLLRIVASCFLGGLFSLYIFLPEQHILIELAIRTTVCLILTFIAFGFNNIKFFIKASFCYFLSNMLFGGIVFAVWSLFKPGGIIINNGMVYFDISPIILISTTVISYFLITLITRFTKSSGNQNNKYSLQIFYKDKKIIANCLLDTGNSLTDNISDRPVILINKSLAFLLLEEELAVETVPKSKVQGFRVIPYYSVEHKGLLPAFKADYIIINNQKIYSVIVAVTNTDFKDYDGLISETLLNNN